MNFEGDKIRSTSFGKEVKPSVPCRLLHVNLTGMKRYFIGKIHVISSPSSPALLLDVSAGNCRRAVVYESGIIITLMGRHNR
jgi:hypothetical protein